MKPIYEVLEQLYKKILLGAPLETDSRDYILCLIPTFPSQDFSTVASLELSNPHGVQGTPQPCSVNLTDVSVDPVCWKRPSLMSSTRDGTLLQLTVIKVMMTRILSAETDLRTKETYRVIIQILLGSFEVDCKLICLFQNSDKLLSHMASECLALLLYFQVREKVTLSNSWITFCQKNLSEYFESDKVVCCLWTLTAVIKEIFKDTCLQKPEILKQFLTPFNATLEAFYNSLFSQRFENCQETSKVINSLVCFLELLELLTASGIYLELQFTCQRLFFLNPSLLLAVPTWPAAAFIRRKFIIFVKKCFLFKVGEDLFRGCLPVSATPHDLLGMDMLALANAVLQAVSFGWLRAVLSVLGKPSCFGGDTIHAGRESNSGPDYVILRAATLVLIKSLEIKFQNCTSPNEIQVDLQSFMSELLTFLKPRLQPSLQLRCPCEWLSRVFMEQDDDMLEAAKASLNLYLNLTRCCEVTESSAQEEDTWNRHTHENGYNPHCVFLFFLKNIGFDSTVLLDFLISSETCFLEYFVRYLKLLQKDWSNFFTICKCFDGAESKDGKSTCGCSPLRVPNRSTKQAVPHYWAALDRQKDACTRVSWDPDASSPPLEGQRGSQATMSKEPRSRLQTACLSAARPSQSLVDYDSSDDSEVDSTNQCLADSKQASLHQEAIKKVQDISGTSRGQKELTLAPQSKPLLPKELDSCFPMDSKVALNSIASEVRISYKTVKCFEELQGAIYRLQKKNLFPYNPTALLKLLKHIEAIYKSMSPL